ncbi:MAG TPA: hypothetical protein VGI03_01215 [Verrucomicrobiae bacterium]|jgi:hypothetical protein
MRKILSIFFCYTFVTASVFAQSSQGSSQSYTVNLNSGLSLIVNQLDHGSNTLNEIMPVVPDGSLLYKYNNASTNWSVSIYYAAVGSWVPGNITLNPGEGAFFQSPTNFTLTFTGTPHVPVLPVTIPNGSCYLLGCQTNEIADYEDIVGTTPANKTKIFQWNGSDYSISTAANGVWNTGGGAGPTAAVGESLWISGPTGGNPPTLPPTFVYQGLTNTSLGHATIEVITNLGSGGQDGSTLVVSNLTSGGQDGVSITLPANFAGLDVNWSPLDVSNSLPAGAYLQETVIGSSDEVTNGILGTITLTKLCDDCEVSNLLLTASFNQGGSLNYVFTVQAYLHGVLVGQANHQSGSLLAYCDSLPQSGDILSGPGGGWDWTNQAAVTFANGVNVTCDHLYVLPENLPGTPEALQVTASQIPVITINSENPSLVYQGLTNTSLGHAAMFVYQGLTNTGHTYSSVEVISNLNSSGQDGVSIAMEIADGAAQSQASDLTVDWLPLDESNSLPTGAYLQSQAVGTANGVINGILGTLTETKIGPNNYSIAADYSPMGSSTCTVQVYYQGSLLLQDTEQSGNAFATVNLLPGGKDLGDIITPLSDEWSDDANAILMIDGTSLPCDQLVVTPIGGTLTNQSALQIVASGIPSLTLTSETPPVPPSLVYQGLTNTSLGHATMFVYQGLTNTGHSYSSVEVVSNLTSGGQDGVSITLTPGYDFAGDWLPWDPSNTLPVGAFVENQVVGTGGGIVNGVLGSTTCTKAGISNYVIAVDYSPLGDSACTVQIYNGSTLVTQFSSQNGPLCSVSLPPGTCTINPELNDEWPLPASIAINGGPTVQGTEILMIPQGDASISSASTEQITGSQIPSLTITSESDSPPTFVYQGLTNTSLGHATIEVITNLGSGGQDGSTLVVSNLTSGGQDGISFTVPANLNITAGGAQSQTADLTLAWEPLDPSNALPVGAYIEETVIGSVGDITNGVLGTVTESKLCGDCGQDNPSNIVATADFNWGTTANFNLTVDAYLHGTLVAQATNENGAALATMSAMSLSAGFESNPNGLSCTMGWGTNPAAMYLYEPNPALGTTNMASVSCDQLVITPQNLIPVGAPTALQITASQIPSINMMATTVSPWFLSLGSSHQNLMLQWYGAGVLQSSTDLITWTDVTNASSPYNVAAQPIRPVKFYRLIFSP